MSPADHGQEARRQREFLLGCLADLLERLRLALEPEEREPLRTLVAAARALAEGRPAS